MFMFKFVKRKLGGGGELIEPQSAPPPVPTVMGSKFNLRYRIYITSNETKDLYIISFRLKHEE